MWCLLWCLWCVSLWSWSWCVCGVACVVWHAENPRVSIQNVAVYLHHAHMMKHTCAWCPYTQRRFERTHGLYPPISLLPNRNRHTQTKQHQRNVTLRQTERERERRQTETTKSRSDKETRCVQTTSWFVLNVQRGGHRLQNIWIATFSCETSR